MLWFPHRLNGNQGRGPFDVQLLKRHPVYGLESVYERMDFSSYENFVESAKSWIGDHSGLRDRTIDGADYRELYTHFCGLMGTEEK